MPNLVLVRHFREGQKHLIELLELGFVACHPFIIGELACGSLKNRKEIIQLLESLPMVDILEHSEIMTFIESQALMNQGIGYIDIHLLGSSILSNVPLWTFDKSLDKAAISLNTEYTQRKVKSEF